MKTALREAQWNVLKAITGFCFGLFCFACRWTVGFEGEWWILSLETEYAEPCNIASLPMAGSNCVLEIWPGSTVKRDCLRKPGSRKISGICPSHFSTVVTGSVKWRQTAAIPTSKSSEEQSALGQLPDTPWVLRKSQKA